MAQREIKIQMETSNQRHQQETPTRMPEAVHARASTEIAVRMLFKPRKATCEHRNAGGLEQAYRAG